MKIFSKLKRFIRRIFVDYGKIEELNKNNVKLLEEKIDICTSKIEENNNRINDEIKQFDDFKNQYGNIKSQYDNIKELLENMQMKNDNLMLELTKINDQISCSNVELLNIKNDENKKNILLVGFYGAPNLGDELMLETLLEYLDNISNTQITILLAENPDYSIDKYKNVRFIHYPKTLYDYNIIAEQFDYIIFGGGAIINDSQFENDKSYRYDLGTIFIKLAIRGIAFNKKIICVGLSSSKELKNSIYLEKLKYVINNSWYFSVRDNYSQKYLIEKLGKEVANKINNINDIVLANNLIYSNIISTKRINNSLNIGIVWIANDNDVQKLNDVLDNIEEYCKNNKFTINLIPFYDYRNIDKNFYRQVVESRNEKAQICIEKYPENMQETIELFKKNDIIIGIRYHSILIANALNIPCIPICYDIHEHYYNKIKHLNELFDQEEALSYKNISDYDITKLIEIKKEFKYDKNYEKIKKIELEAQEQIKEIISSILK